MGIEPSLSGGYRHFHGFFAAFFPFFSVSREIDRVAKKSLAEGEKNEPKNSQLPSLRKNLVTRYLGREKFYDSKARMPSVPQSESVEIWET